MKVRKTPTNEFIYHWQLVFIGNIILSQLEDDNRPRERKLDFDNLDSQPVSIRLVHTQTQEIKIDVPIPDGCAPVFFRRVGSPWVQLNSHRTLLRWYVGFAHEGKRILKYYNLLSDQIGEAVE